MPDSNLYDLLSCVANAPLDPVPRSILADWLDEHGLFAIAEKHLRQALDVACVAFVSKR